MGQRPQNRLSNGGERKNQEREGNGKGGTNKKWDGHSARHDRADWMARGTKLLELAAIFGVS
jgi:hypothetical protein